MIVLSKHENVIKLKPQSVEDLWHLEKIINKGDFVIASTQRKFVSESGKAERKFLTIKLQVEKVEFHEPSNSLKILGKVTETDHPEYVATKVHHSFEISPNDIIKIEKTEWKKFELDRIKEAQQFSEKSKLSILILDERDAELFALKEFGIKELGKVSTSARGKYADESKEVKKKYYDEIYNLIKDIKMKLVIAGPGFEKDNISTFLKDKNFKNFVTESCQNTGRQGVHELIQLGKLDKIMQGTRVAFENKLIEEFIKQISVADGKAAYGIKEVAEALASGRADKLLIIDKFMIENRNNLEQLLNLAEKSGTKIVLVNHENEMSAKLKAFGSIAVILRY